MVPQRGWSWASALWGMCERHPRVATRGRCCQVAARPRAICTSSSPHTMTPKKAMSRSLPGICFSASASFCQSASCRRSVKFCFNGSDSGQLTPVGGLSLFLRCGLRAADSHRRTHCQFQCTLSVGQSRAPQAVVAWACLLACCRPLSPGRCGSCHSSVGGQQVSPSLPHLPEMDPTHSHSPRRPLAGP